MHFQSGSNELSAHPRLSLLMRDLTMLLTFSPMEPNGAVFSKNRSKLLKPVCGSSPAKTEAYQEVTQRFTFKLRDVFGVTLSSWVKLVHKHFAAMLCFGK